MLNNAHEIMYKLTKIWFNTTIMLLRASGIFKNNYLHSDWLRAVHAVFFFLNSAEKSYFSAKRGNKPSILIGQWSKKPTDGQSNLLLSNQVHALDGAIDGAIFPWLSDMHAFLLINHLEMFSCILLISNDTIFLMQFGKKSTTVVNFSKTPILFVFEKFTRAYLFQIALKIMWLPIQIINN